MSAPHPRAEVRRIVGEINDLLCTLNLATWDARTQMPAGAGRARGRHMATLSRLARERATSPELAEAVRDARPQARSEDEAAEVEQVAEAVETLGRLPDALVGEIASQRAAAQEAWENAKAANDFGVFAPALRETVRLRRGTGSSLDPEPYLAYLQDKYTELFDL